MVFGVIVANRRLRNSSAYCQCQRKLLQEEIDLKQSRIRILLSQSHAASLRLSSLISSLDLIHLKTFYERENIRTFNRHQKIQDRKLFRLCCQSKTTDSLNPDNVIFNFSQRLLTDDEKNILRKGLNFCLPPSRLDYRDFLVPFEMFHRSQNNENISLKSGHNKDSLRTKLKDIDLSGFRSYSRLKFIFSKDEIDIINNLKNDQDIFIMRPDKGNGAVIIDRSDYYKKMDDILSDTNKFRKLDVDPITHSIRQENQVKNFLCELKRNGTISELIYNNLFPSGSRPGILYGLGWGGFSVYRKNRGFFKTDFSVSENRKPKNRKTGKNTKNRGKKAQTPLISNPQIALDSSYTPSSVTAGTNQMCR